MEAEPHFYSRPPECFGGKLPFIVVDLIERLKEINAKNTEGIFRLNGGDSELKALCSQLDHGKVSDWSKFTDRNTIACALKKYFRGFCTFKPLIPAEMTEMLQAAIEPNGIPEEEVIKKVKNIISDLSIPNYYTFVLLIKYLREVADNEEISRMNATNLATCIAPNLFYQEENDKRDQMALLKENQTQNTIVRKFIEIGHELFDDVDVPQELYLTEEDIPKIMIQPLDDACIRPFAEWRATRRTSKIPLITPDIEKSPGFQRPTSPPHFD